MAISLLKFAQSEAVDPNADFDSFYNSLFAGDISTATTTGNDWMFGIGTYLQTEYFALEYFAD